MDSLVQFWKLAARLKAEPRRGWLRKLRLERTESVADHVCALSFLCMFEGERRGYDVDKLIKLALLHDMEEAITGDLTPEDKASKGETVVKNEKVLAREKLLSHFPKESQSAYKALWAELEQANNREANLVHELDKLEMALQANEYARKGIEATKLREFYISSSEAVKDPQLRRILVQISVPE